MVCSTCGRELEKMFDLTFEEANQFDIIAAKEEVAETATDPLVVNGYKFESDEELYAYFKAAYDTLAEAKYMRKIWENQLREHHPGLLPDSETLTIIHGSVYIHKRY